MTVHWPRWPAISEPHSIGYNATLSLTHTAHVHAYRTTHAHVRPRRTCACVDVRGRMSLQLHAITRLVWKSLSGDLRILFKTNENGVIGLLLHSLRTSRLEHDFASRPTQQSRLSEYYGWLRPEMASSVAVGPLKIKTSRLKVLVPNGPSLFVCCNSIGWSMRNYYYYLLLVMKRLEWHCHIETLQGHCT